jgi:hypothetical protein
MNMDTFSRRINILDIEYHIHKAANAIHRGLSYKEICRLFLSDGLSTEEIYLVVAAGRILLSDWEDIDEEDIPTKPDHKSPIPPK